MGISEVLANTKSWHVECGNVLDALRQMPDSCVQCIITSPPY